MDKFLDTSKLVKCIWIILWLILLMLIVLKLCFNVWYPITTEHQTFLNICNYIDQHKTLKLIISIFFYMTNVLLLDLTSIRAKRYTLVEFICVIVLGTCNCIIKNYSNTLGMLMEIITLLVFPVIVNIIHKPFKRMYMNILFPIIINIFVMIFQLGFIYIRSIDGLLVELPTFIDLILQLDYYIFLIITWLGVVYFMSTWGVWFFRKDLVKLEAIKLEELKKEHPDKDMLREIDKHIAILKTKKA